MKRRYHYDAATLHTGHRVNVWEGGNLNVSSDEGGTYRCYRCGSKWKAEALWAYWPISVKVFWRTWGLGSHGVEIGSDGIERPIFARVVSIGPLRIIFGKMEGGK